MDIGSGGDELAILFLLMVIEMLHRSYRSPRFILISTCALFVFIVVGIETLEIDEELCWASRTNRKTFHIFGFEWSSTDRSSDYTQWFFSQYPNFQPHWWFHRTVRYSVLNGTVISPNIPNPGFQIPIDAQKKFMETASQAEIDTFVAELESGVTRQQEDAVHRVMSKIDNDAL